MKQTQAVRLSVAALLAALSLQSIAADQGFYAYGSAGLTQSDRKAQTDQTIINAGVTAFSSNAKENDTGYKVLGGYRISTNLSVEAGYVNLGKYKYNAAATVPAATRDASVKADAWTFGIVGSLPLTSSIALIGKVGVADYKVKSHCDGTGIACVNPNRSESDTAFYYGIGADWAFTKDWFARAEYEVYDGIGNPYNRTGTTGTSKADIHLGSVGLGYRF